MPGNKYCCLCWHHTVTALCVRMLFKDNPSMRINFLFCMFLEKSAIYYFQHQCSYSADIPEKERIQFSALLRGELQSEFRRGCIHTIWHCQTACVMASFLLGKAEVCSKVFPAHPQCSDTTCYLLLSCNHGWWDTV